MKAQISEVQHAAASQQKDLAQVKGEVAKQSDVILHSVQQAVGAMQSGLSEQLVQQHALLRTSWPRVQVSRYGFGPVGLATAISLQFAA